MGLGEFKRGDASRRKVALIEERTLQDGIVTKEPCFLFCGGVCAVAGGVDEWQGTHLGRDTVKLVELPLFGRSN